MIKLKRVTIHKYKCFQTSQSVNIESQITTIIGMNESGKTSFLTALAKTNYFEDDKSFNFDIVQDYPRIELNEFEDSGNDCDLIECEYEISESLLAKIENDLFQNSFLSKIITVYFHYDGVNKNFIKKYSFQSDLKIYLEILVKQFSLPEDIEQLVINVNSISDIANISIDGTNNIQLEELKGFINNKFKNLENQINFNQYILDTWLIPYLPKFWYFDEYYGLNGEINLSDLANLRANYDADKTAKALLDYAKINPNEIVTAKSEDYEKFTALLEGASNNITAKFFKYWASNTNLEILFTIKDGPIRHPNIQDKILTIRIKNQRHKVSIPLGQRSKGFTWFFSFIVWFSKIQSNSNHDYVLLLDEPGLNLHASAQSDLLRFLNDLSMDYQIIYTTHSPFMIEPNKLYQVKTCLDTDKGTTISESIYEKDQKTLFPLQAALGYDIAQNLFITKNNLLVEGVSDLVYLTVLSSILEQEKKEYLSANFTIVPVGGLDKVTSFISLLRGQKLNVVCLLDTFTDQGGHQRVNDLIQGKIIKEKNILFFNTFTNNGKNIADIEDMFSKEEYLKLFNESFKDFYPEIRLLDLKTSINTIIKQINNFLNVDRFNHYIPATKLSQLGVNAKYFSETTLKNFENMFKELNTRLAK